jgi:hypothetical protein
VFSELFYPFVNDHSRFMFFRRPDRDPVYAYDDARAAR